MKRFFRTASGSQGKAAAWIRMLLLLLVCLAVFPSCGTVRRLLFERETPPPEAAVEAMCQTEIPLPAGQLYRSSAQPGEAEYVSESFFGGMFGSGTEAPWQMSGVTEYAVYLSFGAPCRFFVFRCGNQQSVNDMSALCLTYLDAQRRYWEGTEYGQAVTEGAEVFTVTDTVILMICTDPDSAKKAARSALRS